MLLKKSLLYFVIIIVIITSAPVSYAFQEPEHKLLQLQPGVAIFEYQGLRSHYEDRYLYEPRNDTNDTHIFAIFDGHGGDELAEYAKNKFPVFFRDAYGTTIEKMKTSLHQIEHGEWKAKYEGCGTTAIIACIDAKKKTIFISNVGDSRLLLTKQRMIGFVTEDQKPHRFDEKKRIEAAGGRVSYCAEAWRVDRCLAMSRVIGNRLMKKTGHVIADPECTTLPLTSENRFLIIASDGLWDGISNEEVIEILRKYGGLLSEKQIACVLGKKAMATSKDNITVMVIDLLRLGSRDVRPNYERFQSH